jgi:hypothetical protein
LNMGNYTHTLAQISRDKRDDRTELQDLIPGGDRSDWPSEGAHGPTAEQTWTGAFVGVMSRSSLWTNATARDAKRKRRAEAVRTRHVDKSLRFGLRSDNLTMMISRTSSSCEFSDCFKAWGRRSAHLLLYPNSGPQPKPYKRVLPYYSLCRDMLLAVISARDDMLALILLW